MALLHRKNVLRKNLHGKLTFACYINTLLIMRMLSVLKTSGSVLALFVVLAACNSTRSITGQTFGEPISAKDAITQPKVELKFMASGVMLVDQAPK